MDSLRVGKIMGTMPVIYEYTESTYNKGTSVFYNVSFLEDFGTIKAGEEFDMLVVNEVKGSITTLNRCDKSQSDRVGLTDPIHEFKVKLIPVINETNINQ